jgi:membrane-bound lytic murein transglycosylase D
MKKIIFLILTVASLYATVTTNTVSSKNLKILNSFNIESDFIEDKTTNQLYNSYLKRKKRYFLNVLENGYSYIPLIKSEIKKANIPTNLVFVSMAESYFSTRARSDKKASGLWQFIPSTARHFGLEINDYVDERRDPIKSTIAAIKYLSYLKHKTGKWYLAIMAYNCGEARIIEAITRAKLDKYCSIHKCKKDEKIKKYRKIIKKYQYFNGTFASLYRVYEKVNKLYPKDLTLQELLKVQPRLQRQYLPKETRKYIRKIIAMSFLLNSTQFVRYQNHYLLNRGNVANLVKVDVPAGTSLGYIAKLLHLDYKTLRTNNMHLKYGFTPPKEDSYIYIPYEKLADFRLNFTNKRVAKKIIYKVKKGDTLASIARKFKIKYKVIKDFNHLHTNLLRINQKLVIPIKHHIKIEKNIVYKVKKGDNLRYLARKFHTSYSKIKKLNKLKSDMIYLNQKLIIPTYITMD